MYNLRYHIASLVGVFLALALGLVLGGLVVQRGAVDRQQVALVEGLRREFTDLRDENRVLVDENRLLGAYAGRVTDEWASGRLEDRVVLIVTNAEREAAARHAMDAVAGAGAEAATVVVLKPSFGLENDELAAQVTSLAGDAEAPLESIAESLVAEWTNPSGARPVTDALVDADVLRIDGLHKGVLVAGLVDVARNGDGFDPAGIALARAFAAPGPSIVGQTPGAESGVFEAAREAKVSGFDTLGTPVGRYTLISLLTGAAPGLYGTGDGADAPFPVP